VRYHCATPRSRNSPVTRASVNDIEALEREIERVGWALPSLASGHPGSVTDRANRKDTSLLHWTLRELKENGRALGLLASGVLLTAYGVVTRDMQANGAGLVILLVVTLIIFALGAFARRSQKPDGG
jgi:hypothetical protein